MCGWYNIEFWNDYENKLDKEKVGLASKTNQDTIKIFVFGLNRSRLNSIVKYTTFIESVFVTGLNYTHIFDPDKHKKLRVYFGDDSEDNLVNEFIIEKFVPYFRRGSLPLLYYEDYIEKGEEELKLEREIAEKFKEIKENLRKEEKNMNEEMMKTLGIPFMIYWCDPETKKMTQVIIKADKEKNEAIILQTFPDLLEIDEECMNKIREGLLKEGFDEDIAIKTKEEEEENKI